MASEKSSREKSSREKSVLARRVLARRFLADRSGVSAMIFALALVPVVGMTAAAVDYGRASSAKATFQRAADAAVIAGLSRDPRATRAQQIAVAQEVFDNTVGDIGRMGRITRRAFHTADGNLRIEISGPLGSMMTGVLGLPFTNVGVSAEAVASAGAMEIALVLDNTGSMRDDMVTLRQGATDLVDTLMANSAPGAVRIAVVPYVAAVNVGGAFPMAYMDTAARSAHHAETLEHETIGEMVDCRRPPQPSAGNGNGNGGGGGGGHDPGPGRGNGSDRADAGEAPDAGTLSRLAEIAATLFGVTPARADVTPNTIAPLRGTTVTVRPPEVEREASGFLPDGFNHWQPCWLGNPSQISHFDLFDRIPNARWKGCVEARPEPYDVTDAVPTSADADTLFVPYFWPDEIDGRTPGPDEFVNDYLNDGIMPPGWDFDGTWQRRASILKYDGVTGATIDETAPTTLGPNAGCPTPMLPLTADRTTVLSRIAAMDYWENGGTIISEGVMWGWRALSPEAPFTEGRPYDEVDKVMVIMSDGLNSLMAGDIGGPTISEYSAYGFLRDGRFPEERFADAEVYLDQRTRLACDNAKAAGVRIFALLYREDSEAAIDLMRDCATEDGLFYQVENQADLLAAFREVARSISEVRLAR